MTRPNVTLWHAAEIILDIIGVQRYNIIYYYNQPTMPKSPELRQN